MSIHSISNITAFDIETPNEKHESICSIGIHHIKKDGTLVSKEFIVNPDDYFIKRNTDMHGINKVVVKNSPCFPEVWEQISEYFEESIVVAHNATFDLSVLFKTLRKYNIEIPSIKYICTQQKAMKHINEESCNGYGLEPLCSLLGVQINNHHNALEDAMACAQLFNILSDKYGYNDEDLKQYSKENLKPNCSHRKLSKESANLCRKALNTLHGILLGINFDQKIYPEEYSSLNTWIRDYAQYDYPDIKICSDRIKSILTDGIITSNEYYSLLKLTDTNDCDYYFCKATEAIQILMGIIEGISCDAKINDMEAFALNDWIKKYDFLDGTYPYDKIFYILLLMLEDNHIDPFEEAELLELINSILYPTEIEFIEQSEISYDGNLFLQTGEFVHGKKSHIESIIIERGGKIANSVSSKIQYIIIGALGSTQWAYGSFGDKVIKAQELNAKGARIKILKESDLFKE